MKIIESSIKANNGVAVKSNVSKKLLKENDKLQVENQELKLENEKLLKELEELKAQLNAPVENAVEPEVETDTKEAKTEPEVNSKNSKNAKDGE